MSTQPYGLYLTVEGTAGSDIATTSAEMVELAKRLSIGVQCRFNDVLLIVGPDTDADKLVEAFWQECDSKRPHKIATGWR